jgi:hypothetical protein
MFTSDHSTPAGLTGNLFEEFVASVYAPLVVSYGVGVDSTAMLVAMQQRGIRPDAILFADTKAEKPETYAYIPVMNEWLRKVGFPEITVVTYAPKRSTTPYDSMEGKWLANETLPSLAFGFHSCATVFKHGPMDAWVKAWAPAMTCWAAGGRVRKAIGYDNAKRDCQRSAKFVRVSDKQRESGDGEATRYDYWFPLQEWGIDREECIRVIESAGLPVPMKSACFFCPASKKSEIVWLRDTHPVLFHRAIRIETGARDGKHGLKTTAGLGRKFAWADLADVPADQIEDDEAELARP